MSLAACSAAEPVTLNVSAASSLTKALTEINSLFVADHPSVTITPSFGASGTLQTQIENGGYFSFRRR
jgi:molybdate transport system substrate-binding protein